MHGKEEKKGKEEGKRRKREENEEKIGDQMAKKEVRTHLFPLRSCHFGSIRNTLFRVKHIISTFVFMQDCFDE